MNGGENRRQLSTAERIAALSRVGVALMNEPDETRLLHVLAQTACDLTGAAFAAFTLRTLNHEGQPLPPFTEQRFHLAAVVGVTPEQEALFQHLLLAGKGLLAPLFQQGVPVLLADVLTVQAPFERASPSNLRYTAGATAGTDTFGAAPTASLYSLGMPPGHPLVRSCLGVPVLDGQAVVRGGLLLGHPEPGRFTLEDEATIIGLATQAAVALEHVELSRTRVQQLEMIIEAIADAVFFVNPAGQVVHANAAARSLFTPIPTWNHSVTVERYAAAMSPREPTGQSLDPAHIPVRRVLNGEGFSGNEAVDVLLRTATGQDRLFNVSGTPVWDANGILLGALMINRDVTECRRLEQVERKSRAEMADHLASLQLILDELPSGVFLVCGHDARLVLANSTAITVWGAYWPPGQPMNEFLTQNGIGLLDMNGQPLAFEELVTVKAVRYGETMQRQSIVRQPSGKTLSVLVNGVALDAHRLKLSLLQTGELPAEEPPYIAIVTYQDITPFKEAERLKDEFIGIAAHELRNPLTVLSGYVQMLLMQTRRGKGPKLPPAQEEALQSIDRSTAQLVELTEDLLDVTRLQGGGWQLHPELTDLVTLLQRTVKQLQTTTSKHTLAVVITQPSLIVYADPARIEQVLSNLIGNAIKYSPKGGPIEITLSEATDTQEARLSVRDYGIGIPEHDKVRIFEHFARASNAEAYQISGTGFGLYLSRELVERHHGRIWFESKEGQGSTFFVALPRIPF